MNPTTQIPIIDGKLNGGKPLSPQQLQQMRTQAGVTSVAKPTSTPSSSNVEARIASLRAGTYGEPVQTAEVSTADKIKNKVHGVIDPVIDNIKGQVKGNINEASKALTASGEGKMNPLSAGLDIAKNTTEAVLSPVNQTLGKAVGAAVNPVIKAISDKVSDVPAVQKFAALMGEHPELGDAISNLVQTGLNTAGIALSAEGSQKGIDVVQNVDEGTLNSMKGVVETPLKAGEDLYNSAKTHLSEANVDPRLETSAKRMSNPLETYNKFLEQEKVAKTDVKADSALSQVGEKVGDSFDKVVKMRKDVGKTMGAELKNISKEPVDIAPAIEKFKAGVDEAGLKYDKANQSFTSEGQSKMTSTDIKMLSDFQAELDALSYKKGVTAKDVDSFVSRMSNELDLYKSKNNILSTTNAERVIKGTLHDMTEQLNPETSGNPAFQKYYDARQSYSKLSDFLDEGQRYLGQKTQSGDYARDVSITKSSVQSLLNGGKKDWLSSLEGLTGYSAMDDAVMALQAMKDMGNPKGASLLQLMSEGSMPVTKSGITQKILDFILNKTKDTLIGSPEEQTQTFLKSILDEKSKSILDDSGEGGVKMGLSTKDITTKLTPKDHSLMQKFIDDVRLKGKAESTISKSEEADLTKMNELLGIDEGASSQTIANKYEDILSNKK